MSLSFKTNKSDLLLHLLLPLCMWGKLPSALKNVHCLIQLMVDGPESVACTHTHTHHAACYYARSVPILISVRRIYVCLPKRQLFHLSSMCIQRGNSYLSHDNGVSRRDGDITYGLCASSLRDPSPHSTLVCGDIPVQ